MAKYFACLCLVAFAATAINAVPVVNSGSSNSGMNVMSSNSVVSQNDVQNAQSVGGYGAAPYYPAPAAYGVPAPAPGYGYYGYPAYDYVPHPGYGYPAYGLGGQVNSHSSNMGANIGSSDSVVSQNRVQNANSV